MLDLCYTGRVTRNTKEREQMKKMTEQQKIETLKAYIKAKADFDAYKKQVDTLKEIIISEIKASKNDDFSVEGFSAKLSTYDRESVSLSDLKSELSTTVFANHIQPLITVSEVQKLTVKEVSKESKAA